MMLNIISSQFSNFKICLFYFLTLNELQTFHHKGVPKLVDTSLLERPTNILNDKKRNGKNVINRQRKNAMCRDLDKSVSKQFTLYS